MQPVPRYENRTIFGDVTGKVGAVELQLMHRPPGMSSHIALNPITILTCSSRLRSPHPAFDLRDVPRCRYPRPRRESQPIPE
jgi:hypothetical protein